MGARQVLRWNPITSAIPITHKNSLRLAIYFKGTLTGRQALIEVRAFENRTFAEIRQSDSHGSKSNKSSTNSGFQMT